MSSRGNWLYVVDSGDVRYIDLNALTSAHFSNAPTTMTTLARRAELVVDGQVITLQGQAAEAAETAVRSIVGQ